MRTIPPLPKRFSAEVIRSDGDRTLIYVDGWSKRLDIYPKTGHPSIVISRPDKEVIWSLAPHTKTYCQSKLPRGFERAFNPDTLYAWTEEGTEKIDDRIYRRFVGRYRETRTPIGAARDVCFVDRRTGMRRRVDSYDKRGKLVLRIDYLNAKIGRLPGNVFEIPPGYKRSYDRRKRTYKAQSANVQFRF